MNCVHTNKTPSVGKRLVLAVVLRYLTVVAAVLIVGSQALAQAVIDRTRVVLDNWSFVPINTTSASGTKVHSFLALKNKADAVGGNIVSVWFVRPAQSGGKWEAKAWESTDQWDAIKTVAAEMGLPADEDIWPTTDAKTLGAPTDTGTAYAKGFLVGDLNGALLEDEPVRDWIIEAMVGAGYTVADISFDKAPPGSPTPGFWLDAMAAQIDAEKTVVVGPGGGFAPFLTQIGGVPCTLTPAVTWSGGWEFVSCGSWTCLTPTGTNVGVATQVWECTYVKQRACDWTRKISYTDACGIPWSTVQTLTRTDSITQKCRFTPAQFFNNNESYPAGGGCGTWGVATDGSCTAPCSGTPTVTPGSPSVTPALPPGTTDPDKAPKPSST